MRRPSESDELPHDIEQLISTPRHAALHGGNDMATGKRRPSPTARKKAAKVPRRRSSRSRKSSRA